jgi:hypothetical protein
LKKFPLVKGNRRNYEAQGISEVVSFDTFLVHDEDKDAQARAHKSLYNNPKRRSHIVPANRKSLKALMVKWTFNFSSYCHTGKANKLLED